MRREPVPVNHWAPARSEFVLAGTQQPVPCFAIPYTAWTPDGGLEADLPRVAKLFEGLIRSIDDIPAAELEEGLTRRRGDPPPPPPAWFLPPEAYAPARTVRGKQR